MKKQKYMGNLLVILIISLTIVFIADYNKHLGEGEIVRLEEWKDEYPEIYASYMDNADMSQTTYGGSVPIDYLEEHPNLITFYNGYGFSEGYSRARGHVYALDDVIETVRPKVGASCLSCKTADFHIALSEDGVEVNKMNFEQFLEEYPETDTISCYDCHRNEPGTIHITRDHLTQSLAYLDSEVSPNNQVCGQCHVEYYLEPINKEVVLPYKYGMDTEGMLQYYDEVDFYDWEHPTTGASLLKAQHPELETYTGSVHDRIGLSCTDCHMPEILGDDNLKSHHWTSPLKSEQGMVATCMTCHTDTVDELIIKVEYVQEQVYIKTNQVSDELVDFIERFSLALSHGAIEGEDLENLRDIHRKAQFKWDFVFVENGEGFHNSEKAHENLDKASQLINEGNTILDQYGY